ncbi:hypothetical protein QAD02_015192 [Eretmocerus hayati]|uniref:Uncharacterized protein n=1 Tax=Eretmocerus hayati TaxID=131215 RepID=A0ACC2P739_9HYME|nr:hypothetical protein QAD02_015192 [Eretmocerus hayati]
MITLQSHNQVLYHLTQLTSALSPRSTPLAVHVKSSSSSGLKKTKSILCENSFSEAVKSCTELALDKSIIQNVTVSSRMGRNEIWGIVKQTAPKSQLKLEDRNHWKVSYISGESFNENKQGFPPKLSSDTSKLHAFHLSFKPRHRSLHQTQCATLNLNQAQVRFFKTNRSVRAELDRNPTLSTRIRKWIGLNPDSDSKLGRLTADELTNSAILKDLKEMKTLSKLHGDKYIKVDELQRIKTAFAEGYLAGHESKPQGRAFKALKFAQQIFSTILVVVLLVAVMGAYRSTTGGGMFKIQLGNRVQVDPEEIHVTFNDVKGVDEAKTELMDVVEFLKNPDKFSALGGKLPKGVLLVGPPGTGKTLLARAVAGEAGVPFFHAAGPEFDEILVGQGARRVRDLFKAAKERAPCVIFIDEIDSVGARRTNSALHPYANQTINQLLSEMDGFHQNEGVIVLGATNRRQDLDLALLRPGRFDSEITVHKPDFSGRKEILKLFLGKVLTRNIDEDKLAKHTIGFTGADIENMINQAALRAAIEGAEFVTMEHLERARDKVIMGPERKSKVMNEEENRITAFHEAGHALVAYFTKDADPLHKITIIPRGQSLGHTSYLPAKDVNYQTKAQMLAKLDMLMGGRAAEELIFGQDKVTSGAASDFQHATGYAEAMVKKFGMSEKVGFRVHEDSHNGSESYSSGTKELIDNEIRRLLQESYDRAKAILKNHSKEHNLLADALLKYETVDGEDVTAIVNGKKLRYEKNDVKRTTVDVSNNIM